MAERRERAPAGLGLRGRRLWNRVQADYEVAVDSREILLQACRGLDVVERLEEALRDAPLTVPGSRGQQVANPLLGEARQWSQMTARLLGQLGLPTLDELEAGVPPGMSRSAMARQAALARWHR